MFIDFTEEKMPVRRHIFKFSRHKVPGGWYVRIIFSNLGPSSGENEAALFLSDLEHSWQIGNLQWEMLKNEPMGGIFRAKAPKGWLLLSTANGSAKTDDGTKYRPRMGSLVFVPDAEHAWECVVINEKDPIVGSKLD